MNKSSKIVPTVTICAFFIIGIITAYNFGLKQGFRDGRLSSSMGELVRIEQHITDQMENSTCAGLKSALNDYLVLIENYKDDEDITIRKVLYHQHKMIAHLILAKIDGSAGDRQEALKHIEYAKEACVDRNWEDCTVEKLDQYTKDYLKEHPIACLKIIE